MGGRPLRREVDAEGQRLSGRRSLATALSAPPESDDAVSATALSAPLESACAVSTTVRRAFRAPQRTAPRATRSPPQRDPEFAVVGVDSDLIEDAVAVQVTGGQTIRQAVVRGLDEA